VIVAAGVARGSLITAALAAIVVFVTWPQAARLATGVNDFGDPLLNTWILAWVAHAAVTRPAGLFDANIFHPEAGTLAYSEPLLLPALAVAPFNWLGGDPILAHNVLLLGGYVLSGLAVFVLVRSLTGSDAAAFVAGVAFAVYPYRTEHYAKVQLQLAMWIPLALWRLHALFRGGGLRDGVLAGAFLALQAYTCVYYAIYGAIFAGLVAVVAVWSTPTARRGIVARSMAAGLLVFVMASAPVAWMLRSASAVVGERSLDEVRAGSATLADYQRPHPESWIHGDDGRPGIGERRLFPGYAAPLVAVVGLAGGGLVPVAYGVAAAGSAVLSLGTNGPGYPWLYEHLEPIRALRVPARFGLFVGLGIAVLAGIGVARLTRSSGRLATGLVLTLAVTAIVAEGRNRPVQLSELPERAPLIYEWLADQPPGAVVEYPLGNLEGRVGPQDPTYQYYSTRHWLPLINGYSGFEPESYVRMRDALRTFPAAAAIDHLVASGAAYLLVHERFYIDGDFEADVATLRADARLRWVGRFAWRDGRPSEAFRVVGAAVRRPASVP
jgi:hypothetical protein